MWSHALSESWMKLAGVFRQASHRRAAVSRGEYIRHCLVKSALRSGFHTSLPVWGWFCFWFLRWHETGLRLSNSKMIIKVSHFNLHFLSVQGSESKTLNTWMSFPMYRTSFSRRNVYKHASVNLHRQMRCQDVMLIYSSNCCWISILAVYGFKIMLDQHMLTESNPRQAMYWRAFLIWCIWPFGANTSGPI